MMRMIVRYLNVMLRQIHIKKWKLGISGNLQSLSFLFLTFLVLLIIKSAKENNHNHSHLVAENVAQDLGDLKETFKRHPMFPIPPWTSSLDIHCNVNRELWDCVGEDREWSLVFADHRPAGRRVKDIDRIAKRTQLIVTHDTEMVFSPSDREYYKWPKKFQERTKKNPHSLWTSKRKAFTDKTKKQWATIIQGDLDRDGSIFDRAVSLHNNSKINNLYKKYNSENSPFGTHIRLLAAAAFSTSGDILEMGTGFYSTLMLHHIIKQEDRMMVSAETDAAWLMKFKNFDAWFHQFIIVPQYSDGGDCRQRAQKPPSPQEMLFAGNPNTRVTSNADVKCPV